MANHTGEILQTAENEWITFPGGELQGKRPHALCPLCRERLQEAARLGAAGAPRQPLCFQCYRADLDRERSLVAAGQLNTASEARFQGVLPLEPLNVPRLAALKALRATARVAERSSAGRFEDRLRQAQIAARHALQAIGGRGNHDVPAALRGQAMAAATHAAELQLPESWLPFVVSR